MQDQFSLRNGIQKITCGECERGQEAIGEVEVEVVESEIEAAEADAEADDTAVTGASAVQGEEDTAAASRDSPGDDPAIREAAAIAQLSIRHEEVMPADPPS